MALGKLGDFWEWNVFLQNLNLVNIRDQITMVFNFFWFRWYLLTQSTIGRRTIWNRVVRLRLGHEGLLSTTTAHVPSASTPACMPGANCCPCACCCLGASHLLLLMCLLSTAVYVPVIARALATCHLLPAHLFLHYLSSYFSSYTASFLLLLLPSFSSERSNVLCISILPEKDQIRTGPAMDQDESGIRNWKPCIYFFFLSSIRSFLRLSTSRRSTLETSKMPE